MPRPILRSTSPTDAASGAASGSQGGSSLAVSLAIHGAALATLVLAPDVPIDFRGSPEQVVEAQRRQIDRLTPEIAAERPNPWKFTLWEDAMRKLGWVDGVLERLIDMREACGGYPEPYDDFATAYLRRETAWEQHSDLVIELYPREEILDRITARSANRFSGGDAPLGDGPLRIPLTPQGYEDLVDSWKIHQAFNREDTTPKPTMEIGRAHV